jgi:CMP-N,N'-diacetyllegionaminic acid synthase
MAFIPAKGNSERVPSKNMRMLRDRNLVQRTIDFADTATGVTSIVVSTDSLSIVEACVPFQDMADKFRDMSEGESFSFGKWVLHKRRSRDASLTSKTIDGILDFFATNHAPESKFLLLQPTSPFRSITEWQEIQKVFRQGADSVFSVSEATSPHPIKTFQLTSNLSMDLTEEKILNLSRPAQELGSYFAADGAYYLIETQKLLNSRKLIGSKSRVYVRKGFKTINIDTEEDFAYAEYIAVRHNL